MVLNSIPVSWTSLPTLIQLCPSQLECPGSRMIMKASLPCLHWHLSLWLHLFSDSVSSGGCDNPELSSCVVGGLDESSHPPHFSKPSWRRLTSIQFSPKPEVLLLHPAQWKPTKELKRLPLGWMFLIFQCPRVNRSELNTKDESSLLWRGTSGSFVLLAVRAPASFISLL